MMRNLSLILLALAMGCYSKAGGEALARQGGEHERRIAALEDGIENERAALDNKVAELQTVLAQATDVVTRNSADVGAEVRRLQEQIGILEGQVAELRNQSMEAQRSLAEEQQSVGRRIEQLARRAGVDMPVADSEIPADRAEHYAAAERAFNANEHSTARALFREYVTRYATDAKADDAQYWIGKSYLVQGRPATALGEFRRIISDFRSGDVVDKALFDMGEAFFALHACTDATSAFQTLIESYPRSPLAAQARQKLQLIRRATNCTG